MTDTALTAESSSTEVLPLDTPVKEERTSSKKYACICPPPTDEKLDEEAKKNGKKLRKKCRERRREAIEAYSWGQERLTTEYGQRETYPDPYCETKTLHLDAAREVSQIYPVHLVELFQGKTISDDAFKKFIENNSITKDDYWVTGFLYSFISRQRLSEADVADRIEKIVSFNQLAHDVYQKLDKERLERIPLAVKLACFEAVVWNQDNPQPWLSDMKNPLNIAIEACWIRMAYWGYSALDIATMMKDPNSVQDPVFKRLLVIWLHENKTQNPPDEIDVINQLEWRGSDWVEMFRPTAKHPIWVSKTDLAWTIHEMRRRLSDKNLAKDYERTVDLSSYKKLNPDPRPEYCTHHQRTHDPEIISKVVSK